MCIVVCICCVVVVLFFFFKQKTAYEMRISDWSSDVCSSDLVSARRFPDKPAILYYGSALSYTALKAEVDRLAGWLEQRCGVKRTDRVLLYMQNSPQFVIAFYAIQRLTAVVVPVNPMSKVEELRHIAADTGATTVLCGQELLGFVQPLLGTTGLQHAVVAAYSDHITAPTALALHAVVALPRPALPLPGATG